MLAVKSRLTSTTTTILLSEEGCDDARNLLVSVLSVEVIEPFSFLTVLALILFFFICFTNYVRTFVEDHDELAICFVEISTELYIHIARDARADIIRHPYQEIDGIEGDIQLALFLIDFVAGARVNVQEERQEEVGEVGNES